MWHLTNMTLSCGVSSISVYAHNTINKHNNFVRLTQRRVQPDQCCLQYKLLVSILSAVCSVILQSQYVLHVYYTLYDGKYDCKIATHQTIFQLQCFVLLNNHQYNCNITKSVLSVFVYIHIHDHTCILKLYSRHGTSFRIRNYIRV